jgi:zinc/manganese transport system substrate-binding protein
MNNYFRLTIASAWLAIMTPTYAALNVFACEPEWASLLQELGGDKLTLYSATTGTQDPHHIEARPGLIAKARNADLLVCTGGELESGWLPQVLRQSANARIQPGTNGYVETAQWVQRLEIPQSLDRSQGDVHAGGNPHIHLDPRNIKLIAIQLQQRLQQLDAPNAAYYQQRQQQFALRWNAAMAMWEKQTEKLRGTPVVVHHKTFSYLLHWLEMRETAMLEPKPGMEPTTAHLGELLQQLKTTPAKLVLRASFHDDRATRWLVERARLTEVVLPATVGGSEQARDLHSLFDDIIRRLNTGLSK